jgi:hypothetical protein
MALEYHQRFADGISYATDLEGCVSSRSIESPTSAPMPEATPPFATGSGERTMLRNCLALLFSEFSALALYSFAA